MFQHTAARRRLLAVLYLYASLVKGFNTQPPEGGCESIMRYGSALFCFNTQPPEGGCLAISMTADLMSEFQHTAARRRLRFSRAIHALNKLFQHTAARRRLLISRFLDLFVYLFQHTAARRRLRALQGVKVLDYDVSTHSRPKAAAPAETDNAVINKSFNTQPPEGGCHQPPRFLLL